MIVKKVYLFLFGVLVFSSCAITNSTAGNFNNKLNYSNVLDIPITINYQYNPEIINDEIEKEESDSMITQFSTNLREELAQRNLILNETSSDSIRYSLTIKQIRCQKFEGRDSRRDENNEIKTIKIHHYGMEVVSFLSDSTTKKESKIDAEVYDNSEAGKDETGSVVEKNKVNIEQLVDRLVNRFSGKVVTKLKSKR